jgi:cytochrome bd-type quinol oxidase subunit 2
MNTPVKHKSFSKIVLTGFVPLLILIGVMFYISYENNRVKELISDWIWLPSVIITIFILSIAWLLITKLKKIQSLEKTNKNRFFIFQIFFIFICFYPINHWITLILNDAIKTW